MECVLIENFFSDGSSCMNPVGHHKMRVPDEGLGNNFSSSSVKFCQKSISFQVQTCYVNDTRDKKDALKIMLIRF